MPALNARWTNLDTLTAIMASLDRHERGDFLAAVADALASHVGPDEWHEALATGLVSIEHARQVSRAADLCRDPEPDADEHPDRVRRRRARAG